MSAVFDIGNAFLNNFVGELLSVQSGDHVLDIGCGTGKSISNLSSQVSDGYFEGVDYSATMVSKARKRNIFHLYTADDVIDLLANSGFSTDFCLKTKSKGNQFFHCVVAKTKT
jgi:predicted TPR repeat methyltransferase